MTSLRGAPHLVCGAPRFLTAARVPPDSAERYRVLRSRSTRLKRSAGSAPTASAIAMNSGMLTSPLFGPQSQKRLTGQPARKSIIYHRKPAVTDDFQDFAQDQPPPPQPGALPLPPLKGRVAKETGFPDLPRAKPLVQTG